MERERQTDRHTERAVEREREEDRDRAVEIERQADRERERGGEGREELQSKTYASLICLPILPVAEGFRWLAQG